MERKFIVALIFVFLLGCAKEPENVPQLQNSDINKVFTKVTSVMVHDVTNPPLAARFFAYMCLSGYEVVVQNDSTYQSMAKKLNGFTEIEKPNVEGYEATLASVLAMVKTAQKLQPSGGLVIDFEKSFLDSCRQIGYPESVISQSELYAEQVSKSIIAYAKADKYNLTTNFPKYTPKEKAGYWYPTPPAYFAAVEPYFNTIRTMTLDSASQFKPAPPADFSEDKNSNYFKLLMEVYEEGKTLPEDHRVIASFWDCNPFAMQNNGHLMIGLKKISPGAHWMGITGVACEKAKKDFAASMKIHTAVAIGLMDAFISCWDEKYRSNRIRPETAIRKYIDPKWEPLLQTPPFPEYTSGHSTVSGASSVILTYYLGENFEYVDDVEESYGIPARSFTSFEQAAKEAAVSRLYGGIHYRDANENGYEQGRKVGSWVLETIESELGKDLANN